jgi:hypothetical protein
MVDLRTLESKVLQQANDFDTVAGRVASHLICDRDMLVIVDEGIRHPWIPQKNGAKPIQLICAN